ncbi:TolC family protein [Ulvibacter litoralis]|uniref:Outer membrane protein TolC n=1 Tax=Ulvibacter litoralis TaxID=227084 RepID=A0A1G7IAE6_9FLAO|nr:TolC family protein [Ulvibacter litoralis]GHC61965.1 transporter [Ulvibacter litoralis]SDF09691.1 Outer membrane protein TolC [Ulvibacter litoralis]
MKTHFLIFFGMLQLIATAQQKLTLEECYVAVEKEYPLSKQSALLEEKTNSEIKVLEKEKLPKLALNAQATYQSDVIEFPFQLPNVNIESPNKDQYRATIDANQLIYNGGIISANTKLKSASLATKQQSIAVQLYTLKNRINQNYFGVLLLQEQAQLLQSKKKQLQARLDEIKIGVKYGAVLPASEQVLQAELLKLEQQQSQINNDKKKALNNLSLLISKEISDSTMLENPTLSFDLKNTSERPELMLFELQENQLETSKEVISKSNFPKISGFAQLGYGNPGLNMLDNSFQEFYMAGLKLNWTLFDWGTVHEKKRIVDISKDLISTEKEAFLLNTQIQLKDAESDIEKYVEMLQKDGEIITLREDILKTTTSQLQHGAITSSEYIIELNNLYEAKIDQQLHNIQLAFTKANYKVIAADFN